MSRYLPDDLIRCSAYWYALRAGMVTDPSDPGDLEFLRELGLRAAHLARWYGIPALTVPEGPWPAVYLWPERIWSEVADAMANHAAEHGDYGPEDVRRQYPGFGDDPARWGLRPEPAMTHDELRSADAWMS